MRCAREETPPKVEVTTRVIDTLRAAQSLAHATTQRRANRSLAWVAVTSAVAAASVAIVAYHAETFNSDPWMVMLYALTGGVL